MNHIRLAKCMLAHTALHNTISLNMSKCDSDLLTAPRNLKDFIH